MRTNNSLRYLLVGAAAGAVALGASGSAMADTLSLPTIDPLSVTNVLNAVSGATSIVPTVTSAVAPAMMPAVTSAAAPAVAPASSTQSAAAPAATSSDPGSGSEGTNIVAALTQPILGEGGLLDDTALKLKADVQVGDLARVKTDDAVKIDDGGIKADVNLKANVANVVAADVAARANVDLTKPSIEVKIPRLTIRVPAGHEGEHGKGEHGKGEHGKGEHGKGEHGKGEHGNRGEGIAVKLNLKAKVNLGLLRIG